MINKVILIGNMGKDPELRQVGDSSVCSFPLATSEKYTDRKGIKQEKTEWHNIVCWGKTADIAARYLDKGSKVYIEGKIQTNKWEGQDGKKNYKTEIKCNSLQFLSGGKDSDKGPDNRDTNYEANNPAAPADEDLPF